MREVNEMCELKVIIDGKTVFNDAVYAKAENNKVIVKDMLGNHKKFEKCIIAEVDINSTRMILFPIEG